MKRFVLVIVAIVAMSTLAYGQSIQRGEFSADMNSEGWSLSAGNGVRTQIIFVSYGKAFETTPEVLIALTGYETAAGKDGLSRVALKLEKVTKEGCVMKVQTWGDSKLNAVYGNWIAFSK